MMSTDDTYRYKRNVVDNCRIDNVFGQNVHISRNNCPGTGFITECMVVQRCVPRISINTPIIWSSSL